MLVINGLQSVLLQLFYKIVDALQLLGDVDALLTMVHALAASDAMAGLTELGHTTVISHEESAAGFQILGVLTVFGDIALVHTFIVMQQHGRDVYAIRTRHAILAVVARNGRILQHELGSFFEEGQIVVGQVFQWRIGLEVVDEVFLIGHTTQCGEHTGEVSAEAEGP